MQSRSASVLVIFLMAIIVMMILPVPSFVLDLGLAFSFGIAVTIFTVTLFIERPLDFSAFPTMLLGSLMLRLSLNISSTKLILSQGHTGTAAAGSVIEGFASFIIGGSLLLGVITFSVILIVNFVVITKGAARMAEVGARFALDGMPGRQMAIDSDVAAGAIGHDEARERRSLEQAEASFLGSLDGASKFVKGDAVAGLLITGLNIVAGLLVGTLVHGLSASDAFEVYAILTIGDGLVTQIPAVIISIASGLLLARSGLTDRTDQALGQQIGRHPNALLLVAAILAVFAIFPGMPFVPFSLLSCLCLIAYFALLSRQKKAAARVAAVEPAPAARKETLSDLLSVDEISLRVATNMVASILDPLSGLEARIDGLRRHIAQEYGLIIPEIRITDSNALAAGAYEISIQGVKVAAAEAQMHHVLILNDGKDLDVAGKISVNEPVFGAPAVWVPDSERETLEGLGVSVITPTEMISTHLLETLKANLAEILTSRVLNDLLSRLQNTSNERRSEENRRLISETIPEKLSKDLLLAILQMLLEEDVGIRNLPMIIEAVSDAAIGEKHADVILEKVRQKMRAAIIEKVVDPAGRVHLLQLDHAWEQTFEKYSSVERGVPRVALPPALFSQLASSVSEKMEEVSAQSRQFVVATSQVRRRFLFSLLKSKGLPVQVLSYEELVGHKDMALLGTIAAPKP